MPCSSQVDIAKRHMAEARSKGIKGLREGGFGRGGERAHDLL